MKLEFERSSGEKVLIAEPKNKEEAWAEIKKFLDAHNFHAPYYRVSPYPDEHRVWIDCSSHTEFFHVTEMTDEELKEWEV